MSTKPQPPSKPEQPEPQLRTDGLSPSEASLAQAIADAMKAQQTESSGGEWKTVKKIVAVKDVALAVVLLSSLVGGAFIILEELRDKPSNDDVQEAIEVRVAPVEDIAQVNAEAVEQVERDVATVKTKVDRIEDVQHYQLEQSAWEGEVLEHLGQRRRGRAPRRPPELEAKERELIGAPR